MLLVLCFGFLWVLWDLLVRAWDSISFGCCFGFWVFVRGFVGFVGLRFGIHFLWSQRIS